MTGASSSGMTSDDKSAETAEKFVSFGFSLQFDAALPGLTEQAQVIITGNRDTLTQGSGTLKLAYEGKRISADVTSSSMRIRPALLLPQIRTMSSWH